MNPEAVAAAGAAVSVQAEVGAAALAIVVEEPSEALREVALAAGGRSAAGALRVPPCPEGADRVMLIDVEGREVPDGMVHYAPERMDTGAGLAPEVLRILREQVGLVDPRPLPPWEHKVSVLRMPADGPEAALLEAAFRSPWTSWVYKGESVFLATDDPAVVAEYSSGERGRVLAHEVALGQLRLVDGAVPDGGRALGDGLAICPRDCEIGVPWHDRRFQHGE